MKSASNDSQTLSALEEIFKKGGSFFLLGHEDPDGDCIGSLAGLYHLLKEKNKDVEILLFDDVPPRFELATGGIDNDLRIISEVESLSRRDGVVVLDSSSIDRVEPAQKAIENMVKEEQQVVNIDHHEDNSHFGTINYVIPDAAATGEILLDMARSWSWQINEPGARALALAMLADTGFFRYSNTDRAVLEKMLFLLDYEVDLYSISRKLYGNKKPRKLKLLGRALSGLRILHGNKIASLIISKDDYRLTGTSPVDRDNIVNYARDIEGVEVGLLFSEEEEGIKVSFRSNDYVDVNKIAAEFGGGGHSRAAGCRINSDIDTAVDEVLEEVKKRV